MNEEKEPSRCCWMNGILGCPYFEAAKTYVLGDPKFGALKLYVLDDQSAAEKWDLGMTWAQPFQTTKEVDQVTLSPEGND